MTKHRAQSVERGELVQAKKKAQIIQNIFSDHNLIKLETNNGGISGKSPNIWKLTLY